MTNDRKMRSGSRSRPRAGGRAEAPRSVGDLLGFAFRSPVIREKLQQYSAFPRWEEIVGPELAEVTIPEKIVRGKVLYLRVIDSVWAQEIALMKPQLLEQIRRCGTGAVIEDIRCTISNPKAFAERRKKVGESE